MHPLTPHEPTNHTTRSSLSSSSRGARAQWLDHAVGRLVGKASPPPAEEWAQVEAHRALARRYGALIRPLAAWMHRRGLVQVTSRGTLPTITYPTAPPHTHTHIHTHRSSITTILAATTNSYLWRPTTQ